MNEGNERGVGVARRVSFPRDVAAVARGIAAASGAAGGWFWLDGESDAGWSYLGVASDVRVAEFGRERAFLDSLRERADPGGPGFFGGWVVALGYEFGVALLGLDPAPDDAAPGFALRVETVLAINETAGVAELRGPSEAALDAWLARFGRALRAGSAPEALELPGGLTRRGQSAREDPAIRKRTQDDGAESLWRQDDQAYRARVEQAKHAIADGDAYVVCLTDTATARGEFDPLDLFLELRERGGAIRGGVVVAGDRALVSASPERFLSVHGGTVASHPIKGTRPRGNSESEDVALASELAADPKELAENLMIVDLMRNDLSRVCRPGTVRVDSFQHVETHTHVHQLVSSVSGELRPGADATDVILSCFPGGSMTGAPKRRAVEILAELESGPRGLYSGCFGWLGGGNAELAMTIRGIELRDPDPDTRSFREARVGAGGGITADSDPELELAEKHLKAAALLRALAESPGSST